MTRKHRAHIYMTPKQEQLICRLLREKPVCAPIGWNVDLRVAVTKADASKTITMLLALKKAGWPMDRSEARAIWYPILMGEAS